MSQLRSATELHNLFLVASTQLGNLLECILTFFRCLNDCREEKDNPLIQIIPLPHKHKRVIVRSFVSLKKVRKIQCWLPQNSKLDKMKSYEHTTNSSVAIIKRMDRLKLIMRNSHLYQVRHIQSFVVPKKLQIP